MRKISTQRQTTARHTFQRRSPGGAAASPRVPKQGAERVDVRRARDLGHRLEALSFRPDRAGSPPQTSLQRYVTLDPTRVDIGTVFEGQRIERGDFSSKYVKTRSVAGAQEEDAEDATRVTTTTSTTFGDEDDRQATANLPRLKVSENRALAIHAGEEQPKEFFAKAEKAQESNQILKSVRATVRLKAEDGGGIELPQVEGKLSRIVPAEEVPVDNEHTDGLQKIERLAQVGCDDFVGNIVATVYRGLVALQQGGDNEEPTEQEIPAGRALPTKEAASYLGGSGAQATGRGIKQAVENFDYDDMQTYNAAGRDYRTLGNQARGTQSENLGLNEHAKPEVGEAFVISSIMPQSLMDKTQNRLEPDAYLEAIQQLEGLDRDLDATRQDVDEEIQAMTSIWGVHFAGVVAKDGDDVITLENYNRNTERDFEIRRVFDNLFKRSAEFREFVASKMEDLELNYGPTEAFAQVIELKRLVEEEAKELRTNGLEEALDQAVASYRTTLQRDTDNDRSLLHFRMYGPDNQSFHAQWQGVTANPLTFRLRGSITAEKAAIVRNLTQKKNQARQALQMPMSSQTIANGLLLKDQHVRVSYESRIQRVQQATTLEEVENTRVAVEQELHQLFGEGDMAPWFAEYYEAIMGSATNATTFNALIGTIDETLNPTGLGNVSAFFHWKTTLDQLGELKAIVQAMPRI